MHALDYENRLNTIIILLARTTLKRNNQGPLYFYHVIRLYNKLVLRNLSSKMKLMADNIMIFMASKPFGSNSYVANLEAIADKFES